MILLTFSEQSHDHEVTLGMLPPSHNMDDELLT